MSLRSEEIFTISSESDYVTFFERTQGDMGRDIAAVKLAMGYTAPSRSTPEGTPSDLSAMEAVTFCRQGLPTVLQENYAFQASAMSSLVVFV